MTEADQLNFYDGDRVGECQLLRRADGDRHCIVAFFTVVRGSGRLDIFAAGTGPVRARLGIGRDFVVPFMEDMRKTSVASFAAGPYPVAWESVDLQGCSTVEDDVATLQRAGLQLWTRPRART